MKEKRRIAVITGSKSDFWQWVPGLEYLRYLEKKGEVELFGVDPASIHRRTLTVHGILFEFSNLPIDQKPHFIITGAGWANHLSGCADSFLRFTLKDRDIVVIAVAMEDPENDKHTQAAITSTTEVPGIQAIYTDGEDVPLVGTKGVLWACQYATSIKNIPDVKIKTPPEYHRWTVDKAIAEGKIQLAKKGL